MRQAPSCMNMETGELLGSHAQRPLSSRRAARDGCTTRASRPQTTTGQRRTGLSSAISVGAKLLYADTLQYHPTGAALSGTDIRRARDGKGAFARRDARQRGGRGVHAPAGNARRMRRLPSFANARRVERAWTLPEGMRRMARHADDRYDPRRGHA